MQSTNKPVFFPREKILIISSIVSLCVYSVCLGVFMVIMLFLASARGMGLKTHFNPGMIFLFVIATLSAIGTIVICAMNMMLLSNTKIDPIKRVHQYGVKAWSTVWCNFIPLYLVVWILMLVIHYAGKKDATLATSSPSKTDEKISQ